MKNNYRHIGILDRSGLRIAEHQLIAQIKYGRAIARGELVHHINEVRNDNRPENLQILSYSEHKKMHPETKPRKPRNTRYFDYEKQEWILTEGSLKKWAAYRKESRNEGTTEDCPGRSEAHRKA